MSQFSLHKLITVSVLLAFHIQRISSILMTDHCYSMKKWTGQPTHDHKTCYEKEDLIWPHGLLGQMKLWPLSAYWSYNLTPGMASEHPVTCRVSFTLAFLQWDSPMCSAIGQALELGGDGSTIVGSSLSIKGHLDIDRHDSQM